MKEIRVNQNIRLEGGFQEYLIESDRKLDLSLSCTENCQALFRIRGAKQLRIRGYAADGVEATLLFGNECGAKLESDESYEVNEDSHLTVAYGECGGKAVDRSIHFALRRPGAHGEILTAALASDEYKCRMNMVNYAPHTLGEMKNFAVVLREGRLMIDAIGTIVNGAKQSKNHQTSRALSFEDGQRSTILPELLIDENDVEASHAMSIGRVDDEQLYYLMSRGLTLPQVTALISSGYLMPVADVISNEEVRTALREELERKLSLL